MNVRLPPAVRGMLLFALVALLLATIVTRGIVHAPTFTDAYYHFVVAERVANGDGLTVPFLWPYIGAPESWPESGVVPSHTYWMPLTSLLAALGMVVAGAPGSHAAAQWPFTLMLAGAALVGYTLGGRIGGTNRHRWTAGLLVLFSGFFTRWWGAIDTFAPYALVGSLALLLLGSGLFAVSDRKPPGRVIGLWFAAGLFSGLGHLTRADGLLLVLVGVVVLLWPWDVLRRETRQTGPRLSGLVALIAGYLLVMAPWFLRNLEAVGTPLPVGGTQAIWFTDYNDLFSYLANIGPDHLFADGIGAFIDSRWTAFVNNLGTFVAVEGLVVMAPLMLLALWNRRESRFLRAFWLYALGLHLAMTLVFPFPGYRGGLFHSAAALVPWWAALGVVGLDDAITWMARRRRTWNPRTARPVFTVGLLGFAIALSWVFGLNRVDFSAGQGGNVPSLYSAVTAVVPPGSRLMVNDPAALYHYTGMGGAVLVNESIDVLPELARRYDLDYLLVNVRESDGALNVPQPMVFDIDAPPPFLTPVPLDVSGVRLYAIDRS